MSVCRALLWSDGPSRLPVKLVNTIMNQPIGSSPNPNSFPCTRGTPVEKAASKRFKAIHFVPLDRNPSRMNACMPGRSFLCNSRDGSTKAFQRSSCQYVTSFGTARHRRCQHAAVDVQRLQSYFLVRTFKSNVWCTQIPFSPHIWLFWWHHCSPVLTHGTLAFHPSYTGPLTGAFALSFTPDPFRRNVP